MASYTHDYEGLGRLLKSAQMQAMVRSKIEKAEAHARAHAPDGDTPEGLPDKYNESFEVEVGVNDERAYARLRNTSSHWMFVEYGNGREYGYRTLGRSLDSI